MMDSSDYEAFCEKILSEIDNIFKNDHEIIDFEIIPVPFNQNKSPVIHLNHHLGVESWCIKYIYEYAHRMILSHKKNFHKNHTSIIKYLNSAILINPDVSTFWNIRRNLVEKMQLNVSKEFQYSAIVLSKKPKSNEAFFYRRFLYSFESLETIDWNFELGLCEKCAEKKNGNYHAWNHRQWVLQKSPDLLNFELIKTEKSIRKNVSDYSCYHHRSVVLSKLFEYGYYDLDELNGEMLLKCVNDVLHQSSHRVISSADDLLAYLIPKIPIASMRTIKLNCFLYCLYMAFKDIQLCNELSQIYGNYEAFTCYKRITIKFIVDILRIVNQTNYLLPVPAKVQPDQVMEDEDIEFLKFIPTFFQLDEKYCNIFLKLQIQK